MTNNSKAASASGNPQEKTILIASEDETLWELLYYIVHKEGFLIEKADSLSETMDKARALRPALILLGLKPQDSYATLRELQTDDSGNIPIILIANRKFDQSTTELIRQEPNVKGLLQQPADTVYLTALLHNLLKTRPTVKKKNE
jgi:DNA-binding response OmpR family regulator